MRTRRLRDFSRLATLGLSLVCLTTPAWADFKAGEKAYQRNDYGAALHEWQPLAKQGQAAAQYQLGLLYANGQGVPKDDAQARKWYEKAANQGHGSPKSTWRVCAIMAVEALKISGWQCDGIFELPIKVMI